jgi:pyruvate/2-oxoglutarate dehydrogenase complex dihydrolipoamide acyltransferase (E2) component
MQPPFRKAALERLSSPERLDELLEVTTPRSWLALAGLSLVLLVAVIWGLYGSVPTLIKGQGVLMRAGSLRTVESTVSGRVWEILVREGDEVVRDAVVAWVYPTENQAVAVTSPYSGRVLDVRVARGDVVQMGTILLSLEQPGGALEALIYLPPLDGKKVLPGMTVQIAPASVKQEEYGLLLARVYAVGSFPATQQGMRRLLGSDELAKSLSSNGAPIEVRAELERNPNTYSGYQWTSTLSSLAGLLTGWLPSEWTRTWLPAWATAQGPPVTLESGTLVTADVITGEQAPIYLVLAKFNRGANGSQQGTTRNQPAGGQQQQ